MWAALDRRKSHNSIMRSPVPLPGLLQTFLCILNFLALAGKIVMKNGMRVIKVTVNYYLALKVKWLRKLKNNACFLEGKSFVSMDNFRGLIELKIGFVEQI